MGLPFLAALLGAAVCAGVGIAWWRNSRRKRQEQEQAAAALRQEALSKSKKEVVVLSFPELIERLTEAPCKKRYIMMIGAQGSGKTTIATKLAEQGFTYLSMDQLLEQDPLLGTNLMVLAEAFNRKFSQALDSGANIVDDNLNVDRDGRKNCLARVRKAGYEDIILVHLDTSLELCLIQNKMRSPSVPDGILEITWDEFNSDGIPTPDEGRLLRVIPMDHELKRCEFYTL